MKSVYKLVNLPQPEPSTLGCHHQAQLELLQVLHLVESVIDEDIVEWIWFELFDDQDVET